MNKFNNEFDLKVSQITKTAQLALTDYQYPGNVRELSNIIEHAIVMADGTSIDLENLPDRLWAQNYNSMKALPILGDQKTATKEADTGVQTLAEIEKKHIQFALASMGQNQTEVAKKLGISRSTLWRKLQEHKIKIEKNEAGNRQRGAPRLRGQSLGRRCRLFSGGPATVLQVLVCQEAVVALFFETTIAGAGRLRPPRIGRRNGSRDRRARPIVACDSAEDLEAAESLSAANQASRDLHCFA